MDPGGSNSPLSSPACSARTGLPCAYRPPLRVPACWGLGRGGTGLSQDARGYQIGSLGAIRVRSLGAIIPGTSGVLSGEGLYTDPRVRAVTVPSLQGIQLNEKVECSTGHKETGTPEVLAGLGLKKFPQGDALTHPGNQLYCDKWEFLSKT